MTQKSGLAAVLAAITGKQPAGDSMSRTDHMTAIEAAVTQAFGEGEASGKTAHMAAGANAERTRVAAILGSEEAKGREAFAQVYAFETEMSAEAAITALKGKPKAEAPKQPSRLDGNVPQPKLGPGEGPAPDAAAVNLGGAVDRMLAKSGLKAAA